MKIGIDIDEVVAGFIEKFLNYSNKKNKTSFTLQDVTNYNLRKTRVHKHKSREEDLLEISEFQNSEDFNLIELIEGAKNGLEKLSRDYEIYFITSRPEEIKEKTKDFFYNNFPENGYKFIFSGDVYGGKTKSQICNELEISLMVEDNPFYALDCAKKGIKTFLLDKPWNKNYEKHENIIKVNNWKEILEKLNVEREE